MRLPHHGQHDVTHVGRIRIRLAKIISESLNLDCIPEDLKPATGRCRTDHTLDLYRWEVFCKTKTGMSWVRGSFYTMTECVKAGAVVLDRDGEIGPAWSR